MGGTVQRMKFISCINGDKKKFNQVIYICIVLGNDSGKKEDWMRYNMIQNNNYSSPLSFSLVGSICG